MSLFRLGEEPLERDGISGHAFSLALHTRPGNSLLSVLTRLGLMKGTVCVIVVVIREGRRESLRSRPGGEGTPADFVATHLALRRAPHTHTPNARRGTRRCLVQAVNSCERCRVEISLVVKGAGERRIPPEWRPQGEENVQSTEHPTSAFTQSLQYTFFA